MKSNWYKKILNVSLGVLMWQFLLIPIKTFAVDKLEYQPLESRAFGKELTSETTLSGFLSQAFSFGLAIAAALAVVMIVWGGVEIMLSESVFNKDDGKKKIQNAIYGLLLALFSWLILYTINPSILDWSFFN